jgi:leucyl/phenylalanyl-tRNA--protein transferase
MPERAPPYPVLLDPYADECRFPEVGRALAEPNGLLAIGGNLRPDSLLAAYRRGIFPWYENGQPILWWSPDPRLVLFPERLRVTRSLRKTMRQPGWAFSFDRAFETVMRACAAPREPGGGTWITEEMVEAYLDLHRLGHAHSVEVWHDGGLAGGLYGVALGRVFFGESMFHRRSDASKIALAALVHRLRGRDCAMIDCQMQTAHLASLGAETLPRAQFAALLAVHAEGGDPGGWETARSPAAVLAD